MQAWSYRALPSPISVKHPELGWGSCVLPVPPSAPAGTLGGDLGLVHGELIVPMPMSTTGCAPAWDTDRDDTCQTSA